LVLKNFKLKKQKKKKTVIALLYIVPPLGQQGL
jgi:hypothetical protein